MSSNLFGRSRAASGLLRANRSAAAVVNKLSGKPIPSYCLGGSTRRPNSVRCLSSIGFGAEVSGSAPD